MAEETKERKVNIPDPPALLPPAEKKKWRDTYLAALKEAENDFPEDKIQQRQVALKEANRLLRVPDPTDYKSAMAIPDHLVHKREIDPKKGEIALVTIHGKKFRFPAPKKEIDAAAAAAADTNGGSGGPSTN